MTTWSTTPSICLLLSFLLRPATTVAQQQTAPPPELQSLPVYVVGFTQSDPIREIGDLGAFATGLIDLRLLEVPSLTVHRVPQSPSCGNVSSAGSVQTQMSSTGVATGDYYVVRGSIEVRLPEIVLDYFVEKCENQALRKILEDTQPFTLDHAREELTMAAHAIAYKIERATPPTAVTVELFEVEGDAPDKDDVQKEIQREVAEVLSKSSSLEVTDNSPYRIGGKITFQKNSSLLRPFAKSTLQAELHIDAPARTYPISTIAGSGDALVQFYSQIAAEAQRFLPQVLLAEHLGLPEVQGNMKIVDLLNKGSQLLAECSADGHVCQSAQDAIPLLASATQQNGAPWKAFWLLGQAQMLTWKYADAATSLEKASKLAKQDEDSGKLIAVSDRAQIFSLLGDAYRNIEKYDLARTAFDQSLALSPSQPQLYAKKALALRLSGNRLASLEVILDGIKAYPDNAQPLHDQARDVIRALQKDEFDRAETLLGDANRAGLVVNNEYASVLSRKWEQILDANWTAQNRAHAREALDRAASLQLSDPNIQADVYLNLARSELRDGNREKLHTLIAAIEKLPVDQVAASRREWAKRISAQDSLDHEDFETAYTSADAALRIEATDQGNFMASETRMFLARHLANATDSTPAQREEAKKLYRESADMASPLVLKGYPGAEAVLAMANHALDEDRKTREQFDRMVKANPTDASALNGLMWVCSQYQFDGSCAFSTAQKIAAVSERHGANAALTYLNIAEVAVLTSNDGVALEWLDVVSHQPDLRPRDESLVYFYRLWIFMRRGQAQESLSDFQAWSDATQRFRQTHQAFTWIFDGVRKALSQERLAGGGVPLLLAMAEALEDSNKPLPTWPKLATATTSDPN